MIVGELAPSGEVLLQVWVRGKQDNEETQIGKRTTEKVYKP
jgi:hypothetical protein